MIARAAATTAAADRTEMKVDGASGGEGEREIVVWRGRFQWRRPTGIKQTN